VANDGISIVQNFFVDIAHDVRNFGQSTIDLFGTHEENQRLRRNMYHQELANIQIEILQEQVDALTAMLEIDATLEEFERLRAVTIGRDIPYWHDFLTLNQGTLQGVERDMAIVSPEGFLIGRITSVTPNSSRVQLMKTSNTNMRAHVEVLGVLGTEGIFHGYDLETQELIVTNVDPNVEIEIGERVITSGLGGMLPRGLFTGYVTRTERTADGLSQNLFLTNHVEYDALRYVFIIKRNMPNFLNEENTPDDEIIDIETEEDDAS